MRVGLQSPFPLGLVSVRAENCLSARVGRLESERLCHRLRADDPPVLEETSEVVGHTDTHPLKAVEGSIEEPAG